MMKNFRAFKIIISIFLIFSMLACVGCNEDVGIKTDNKDNKKAEDKAIENTTVEVAEDEELALVVIEKRQKCAFINEKGEIVLEFDVEKDNMLPMDSFFSNGLAPVQNTDGKYGYINKNGEVVIEPQFDDVGFWSEGLLSVEINEKYGFVSEKGEFVVDAKYDSSSLKFENGLASVELDGRWGYVNAKGDTLIEHKFDTVSNFSDDGLACAGMYEEGYGYRYGYINKSGEWVLEPIYKSIGEFSENGLACVKIDDKYGYINKKGEFVIEPQFESAGSFHENGLAIISVGGKDGVINEKGEIVIQPKYDRICRFCDNGFILALIGDGSLKEDNYFYMNENEEVVINNQSVRITDLESDEVKETYGLDTRKDLAPIIKNDKFGYIDNTGKVVIEPIYDYTYPYVSANGLIAVEKDGNWGYINEKGEVIIPFQFYDANPFS